MYANESESAVSDFEEMGASAVLGASIYDVRTEGGSRNTPNLRTNSIDDFADKEGEGGQKIPKSCGRGRHIWKPPAQVIDSRHETLAKERASGTDGTSPSN